MAANRIENLLNTVPFFRKEIGFIISQHSLCLSPLHLSNEILSHVWDSVTNNNGLGIG
jgi:hypothetical protein